MSQVPTIPNVDWSDPALARRLQGRNRKDGRLKLLGLAALGAAGAIEAIFCILAMRDNVAPPTLNLEDPSVETEMDLAPLKAVKREINVALSNSFGFGGTNATLALQRYNG